MWDAEDAIHQAEDEHSKGAWRGMHQHRVHALYSSHTTVRNSLVAMLTQNIPHSRTHTGLDLASSQGQAY